MVKKLAAMFGFSTFLNTNYKKRPVLRLVTIGVIFIGVALIVYARTAHLAKGEYGLASDLPRGAFVYVQFSNLPALIEQWNHSQLKEQYLNSTNYQQLQHRHLMLKLISRWEEFQSALGFPLDVATLTGASENRAALAVYDIGRMDLVFLAPLTEQKATLTQFFTRKDTFEETEMPDGTVYYRQQVEADRGRQKQVVAFTTLNGRFILATNENLLLHTVANIKGEKSKDRLADDPAFKNLSERVKPHFLTVWVDQTKLNQDYYFKHYWLMQNTTELATLRAGMFDLEQQEGRWVERREFLTTGQKSPVSAPIATGEVSRLSSMVPEDTPLVRIRSLQNSPRLSAAVLRDTLFDMIEEDDRQVSESWRSYGYDYYDSNDDYDDDWSSDRYSYLDSRYDSLIDDPYDARTVQTEEPGKNPELSKIQSDFFTDVLSALAPARPSAALVATRPHMADGPLFVEFRKVAVIHLQAAGNLKRDLLEKAIGVTIQSALTTTGRASEPVWEEHKVGSSSWRQLQLPLLGWEVCYTIVGENLIVANSTESLQAVLTSSANSFPANISRGQISDLTIVSFSQRKAVFDDVMNSLDKDDSKKLSETFFSGNIASLLDVAAEVKRIEIARHSYANGVNEEISFVLNSPNRSKE